VTRLFISTGEVSGDLQGALLIEALKRQAEMLGMELEIVALGGDRMAKAGATLLGHTSEIGSMGIFESLRFVFPTLKVQRQAKQYLKQHPPDMAILIDYMSPNIAWCGYFAKSLPQIPVVYYIAPQEWVWSLNSYNTKCVVGTTKLLAIFPEEANYFQQKWGQVSWVGHPLVDRMKTALPRECARAALGIAPDQILVTLLPASRQQEIKYLLPVICKAAQQIQARLPDVRFLVPLALEKYRQPIEQAIQQYELQATVISDHVGTLTDAPEASVTLQAIAAADLAITKSGTVNLEIALLKVPQVVLYKVNPATAWVARHLLKFSIPFMSPPNLVLMKPIVPEFMQDAATPEAIAQESLDILLNSSRRQAMMAGYQMMQQALGEPGVCDRAATEILQLLPGKSGQ
jgi:lipid-A-disaccharide synthase